MLRKNILFLTLNTYSLTGGIEKVCLNMVNVLIKLKERKVINNYYTYSMHDQHEDSNNYQSYKSNKIGYALATLKKGLKSDIIILSHINLLIFAKIIKLINPRKRIILFAHGIEIWKPIKTWQKDFLNNIEIWAVSKYTAKQIQQKHQITNNITVLNNSLPVDFRFKEKIRPFNLIEKYQISSDHHVILTICRLSSLEQYKGYDHVLLALRELVKIIPNIIYFIVGKADQNEADRINHLISIYGLNKHVICTGYITNEEIDLFYQMADVFVMPSKSEGFGLVFIEAIAYGCNVLSGNSDGSSDALLNGELGLMVDPENTQQIYDGLKYLLNKTLSKEEIKLRQDLVYKNFGFERYVEKVEKLLSQP